MKIKLKQQSSYYYCQNEQKQCIRWIKDVFKDCLCNLNDEISFAFGMASLLCWSLAEIPQIITNFRCKSASGVSLTFLSTWIVGDVFNLIGCIIEPATLPTQFYTAVLYTTVTVILALQCIYYTHYCPRKRNEAERRKREDESDDHLDQHILDRDERSKNYAANNAPVEVPHKRESFYYMSARSFAGSDTPPNQSYIKARSGPSVLEYHHHSSSDEEEEELEEEESNFRPKSKQKFASKPRVIPRSVGYGTFIATSAYLPHLGRSLALTLTLVVEQEFSGKPYGQLLGWLMAVIYMGGRIPQIWLNIKRGSVEGLNPWMFIFALLANATYVGSILVRTTEWEKIKANMPWLLDAIVCVMLDLFIIFQYIFYSYIRRKKVKHGEECHGDYMEEADKPTTA